MGERGELVRASAQPLEPHSMDEAVRLGDRVVLMTPRPGRIQEEIAVPLPRPRPSNLDGFAAFLELKEYLWRQLRAMQIP